MTFFADAALVSLVIGTLIAIVFTPKTLLHQKAMTVDGKWCAIGSTNSDDRAFEINDEITIVSLTLPSRASSS